MSLIERAIDRIFERYFIRYSQSERSLRITDFGFDARTQAEYRRAGYQLSRIIQPVAVLKPSDGTFPDAAAGVVDPFIRSLNNLLELPYTATNRANLISKKLTSTVSGANTRATFDETPEGGGALADYDVPTSKIFEALGFMHYTTAVAKTFRWTYGDTGVADGTAAPTNEVELGFGGIQVSSASTIFSGGATNPLIPIHFKVPAGKFPCQACSVDVGGATNILYGVEYDA